MVDELAASGVRDLGSIRRTKTPDFRPTLIAGRLLQPVTGAIRVRRGHHAIRVAVRSGSARTDPGRRRTAAAGRSEPGDIPERNRGSDSAHGRPVGRKPVPRRRDSKRPHGSRVAGSILGTDLHLNLALAEPARLRLSRHRETEEAESENRREQELTHDFLQDVRAVTAGPPGVSVREDRSSCEGITKPSRVLARERPSAEWPLTVKTCDDPAEKCERQGPTAVSGISPVSRSGSFRQK